MPNNTGNKGVVDRLRKLHGGVGLSEDVVDANNIGIIVYPANTRIAPYALPASESELYISMRKHMPALLDALELLLCSERVFTFWSLEELPDDPDEFNAALRAMHDEAERLSIAIPAALAALEADDE